MYHCSEVITVNVFSTGVSFILWLTLKRTSFQHSCVLMLLQKVFHSDISLSAPSVSECGGAVADTLKMDYSCEKSNPPWKKHPCAHCSLTLKNAMYTLVAEDTTVSVPNAFLENEACQSDDTVQKCHTQVYERRAARSPTDVNHTQV